MSLLRERAERLVETPRFQHVITAVILVNAVTLGAETSAGLVDRFGGLLHVVDRIALTVFVAELVVKLYAYGVRYFRDPWNCFDFVVVGISVLPMTGGMSVLRALRVLRVLRLVSIVPSMRRVVSALLTAIPGVASIMALLGLITYVGAVMATNLFRSGSPQHFGDLGTSLWTLFQVMTGEAWPDVARDVMSEHPGAWVFFLIYILISTFVVLNLFLAVIVSAMEETRDEEDKARDLDILDEISALRTEIGALRQSLAADGIAGADGAAAADGADGHDRVERPAANGHAAEPAAPVEPSESADAVDGRSRRGAGPT